MKTFLSEVLAGRETEAAVDDWVEAWHTGDGEGLELHEYLGMTWDEYGDWARFPSSLSTIVHTRQQLEGQV